MTPSVDSARAAARVFDFRSFLLITLETTQEVAGLLEDAADVLSAPGASGDVPADDQWVAWADPATESAWIDAELVTEWSAAAEILGWRA
jgi:hypothetical protein